MYESISDKATVSDWITIYKHWFPKSINTYCPFCGRLATFATADHFYDDNRKTLVASAVCPACGETLRIWMVDPGNGNDVSQKGKGFLFIYPYPALPKLPMSGLDNIPERVVRAYKEALEVFNAQSWNGSAVLMRRTLEGVVNNLLPESERSGNLANLLGKLPNHVDLSKPLLTLSNAVRQGGNLGAHFDDDKDTDQMTAEGMLVLIEYLLEYIYVLPKAIDDLNQRLSA